MYESLKRIQLKEYFKNQELLKNFHKPKLGWIRTCREYLGMPSSLLARRLNVSVSRVSVVESTESSGRTTINTLKRYANALDCELVYMFVPKQDIEIKLRKMAEVLAERMIQQLKITMDLEDQAISQKELMRHKMNLIQKLLDDPKKLWENLEK
jgi:predicted DNA-binding mobile mystery protein A